MKIGIIGMGVVGNAHAKLCESFGHNVLRYDKYKKVKNDDIAFILPEEHELTDDGEIKEEYKQKYEKEQQKLMFNEMKNKCDMIFLCLPTPSTKNGISMEAFEEVMPELIGYKGLVVIKSTVLPTTCASYSTMYNLRIAHNPEFLTEANAVVDTMQPDKIIIGRKEEDKELVDSLVDLYTPFIKTGKVKLFITNTITSELCKYASNCFLAMKVSFANEWFDICKQWKEADYDIIKNSLYADNRIGNTHLEVKKDTRYWGGMCFPKDTVAMHKFLEEIDVDHVMLYSTIMKNVDYAGDYECWWDDEGKQLI